MLKNDLNAVLRGRCRLLPLLLILISATTVFGTEVPFKLEKGLLLIPVTIKKGVAVEAVLSTGSAYSGIEPELAKKHGIKLSYGAEGPVTGSNDRTVTFAEVSQVSVGELTEAMVYMKLRPMDAISKRVGRDIGAVIGADLLKGKILQIDFRKRVIRLVDKTEIDYKQLRSAPQPGVLLLPMAQTVRTFYGTELTLPVATDVSYQDKKVRTLFETGTPMPISFSAAAMKDHAFGAVPDKGKTSNIQISRMSIGGYELENVPAMAYGKDAGFSDGVGDYDAIIGLGVMQNFLVTFDFKERMMIFQR